MTQNQIEIIVGTYENIVIGYYLKQDQKGIYSLDQSFTDLSHTGCITSIAATDKFLASGSSDEAIQISKLDTRTDVGSLVQHDGSVTALRFFDNYLFSGSEDSNICIWKVKKWKCEKTLRGHKKAITGISVHPSGKIALSTSNDKSLRTWNLIKGRSAYIKNIHSAVIGVEWTENGEFYAVQTNNNIDVYELKTAGLIYSIKFEKSIHCFRFLSNDILVFGGEDDSIYVHDISSKCEIANFSAHKSRVKAINSLSGLGDEKSNELCFVSSSNDGYIKVWKFNSMTKKQELLAEIDTTCRITCQTVSERKINSEESVSNHNAKRELEQDKKNSKKMKKE